MKPYEHKTSNQQNALDDEKRERRPINPMRLMKLTLNRTSLAPKSALLKLNEKLERQRRAESLENVRDKIRDEKEERAIDHQRKCKVISLENPANSRARKAELAPMLCDVSRVFSIPLPKVSAGHRVCRPGPTSRVPGLFVGAGPGGGVEGGVGVFLTGGGADGAGALGCPDGLGVGADGLDINFSVAKSPNEKS
jgi:hypothetical protein